MKVNFVSDYKKMTGFWNMDFDLSMLDNAIKTGNDDFYVRFYGWEPKCVSLGRNQKDFKTDVEIDIVRRPTGGRALLHDMEITYCVAGKIPEKQSVIETYRMISDILIKGFKRLDINLSYAGEKGGNKKYCMNISSGADICFEGKKFIGSAQFRKEGYFLQHGSILKDVDRKLLEEVFKETVERDKIITLKEINAKLTDEDIINALALEFREFCNHKV
ncbi:MAG: hypothetical protein Q4F80_01555 [bacterium]|nr:hypothetical protein [bacterium]